MEIKVQDRKEGGWMVTGAKDGYHSFRYIIPTNDRFLVINSFKLESHFADVSDFDTALDVASASLKNAALGWGNEQKS